MAIQFKCSTCGKITEREQSCPEHSTVSADGSIISFIETDTFDDHWDDNFTDEVTPTKVEAAEAFLTPFVKIDQEGVQLSVLDIGCGDGMHIEWYNRHGKGGHDLWAMDISGSALKAAQKRDKNKQWNYLQADACKLPFADDSFDVSYSYGVLGYTDDPLLSFKEMVRVTKPNGHIGLWLYPKTSGLGSKIFGLVRGFCKLTGKPGTALMANMIVPFLGVLPTTSKLSLRNASWKQCREIVLVNIAPTQLYFPKKTEVEEWFKKHNLNIHFDDPKIPITLWANKTK